MDLTKTLKIPKMRLQLTKRQTGIIHDQRLKTQVPQKAKIMTHQIKKEFLLLTPIL